MYDDAYADVTKFRSKNDAELKEINREVDDYLVKYKRTRKFKENTVQNPEKLVFKFNDARIKTTEKTFDFNLVN